MARLLNDTGVIDLSRGEEILDINDVTKAHIQKFKDHQKLVEDSWNKYLRLNRIGLKFKSPFSDETIPKIKQQIVRYPLVVNYLLGGESAADGLIHENQIATTVELLAKCIRSPGMSGICLGATMCGKTGTSNNSHFIAPALYLLTGQIYHTITLLPNKRGIEDQAQDEYNRFMSMYGGSELFYKNKAALGLQGYYHWHSRLPDYLVHPVIRRSKGTNANLIKNLTRSAAAQGISLIFIIDEPDWGAGVPDSDGKGGVQWDILSVSEELLKAHGKDILIGFSATPWPLVNVKNLWEVRHKLAKGYCGFNMFNGKPIDPDLDITMPEYMCFADFAKRTGLSDFTNIHCGAYFKESTFINQRNRVKNMMAKNGGRPGKDGRVYPDSWLTYRRRTEMAIASAINYCLVGSNNHSLVGFTKRGKGMVVRIQNNNINVRIFAKTIKKNLNTDIEELFYMDGATGQSIKKMLRQRKDPSKPYIIYVTGAARMADYFPPEVKYFLELAESSNLRAIFQGLLGRSTGHGKDSPPPIVILTYNAKVKVDDYVDTKGRPSSRPCPQVDMIGGGAGAPKKSITLRETTLNSPSLKKMWSRLQLVLSEYGGGGQYKPRGGYMPFWNILGPHLDEIEANRPCSESFDSNTAIDVLRPGHNDSDGWSYMVNQDGWIKVGLRMAEHAAKDNSNLANDRAIAGGKGRSERTDRIEMQVHVVADDILKWRMVAVRLRLRKPAKAFSGSTLPNDKTGYESFLNEDERMTRSESGS